MLKIETFDVLQSASPYTQDCLHDVLPICNYYRVNWS